MRRRPGWQLTLALILIALSALVYYAHYLIFRDPHHIFLYFVGDIGFVFFEVLLVTLIIHRLLHHREQRAMRDKVHMLVGAFYSELGTGLLRWFAETDEHSHRLPDRLIAPHDWSEVEFLGIREITGNHEAAVDSQALDLEAVKTFLLEHKRFLLDLLQNESLVQNEPFTNLVWAVYHLAKELEHRGSLTDLPASDRAHLDEDIGRVYELLLVQWTDYMKHLRRDHPHLFSLASRTNPFDRTASVEVR